MNSNIKRTRKTQRDGHNSGVKIWSLCSVSSSLSHANLEQPFRTLAIKWEVNMLLKKSSCVFLPASFLPASSFLHLYHTSFIPASLSLRLLSLRWYVSSIYMYISAWISRWQCNTTIHSQSGTGSNGIHHRMQFNVMPRILWNIDDGKIFYLKKKKNSVICNFLFKTEVEKFPVKN